MAYTQVVTRRHTLGSLVFSGFNLTQVMARTLNIGINKVVNYASGQVSPSFVGVMSSDPMLDCSTTEIARFLTNVDASVGCPVSSTSTNTSLAAYFTKLQDLGTRASGTNHFSLASISKALVIPKTLTVDQDREATITFDVHLLSSDGTTAPYAYSDGIAIAPASILVDQKFTLGPALINGTQLDGLQGWSCDFGLSVTKTRASGGIYPYHAAIMTGAPKFSFRVLDTVALSTYALLGTAQGLTASDFYLLKMANMGSRTANATTEHIRFRVNASQGLFNPMESGGSNNEDNTTTIECQPIVGSSAIITVAAGTVAMP